MKGFVVSALVAALLCVVPAVARAESSDEAEITAMAKEHYKLGLDAYKNGKYPEAIKELKKAYLLKRLPALLLNIGATYRKMGDVDNAVYYYKKYLAEAPDAKDRGEVQRTLAELDKEKPGAGAGASGAGSSEPTPPASESPAPPATTEWKHTPVDAAPPDQPLDVRVQMPVQKGVKVYVYYRGAGQAEFSQVLMRRHGGEKVGRIPSDAMSGKSLQYYVEGKDDKGNVVKSFGSPSDPNIVRIDSSAAPQVVASSGGEAAASAGAGAAHADLDDEAAPITGEIAEKPGKKHKSSSGAAGERTARFGTAFWAGAVAAVVGIAGVAIGGYFLYQAKSYSDVLTADSLYRDPTTGLPYKFTDPNATPYDDKTVEARGVRDNNIGIALTTVGGIALAGGVVLMAVDQTLLKHRGETQKRSAWLLPTVGPNVAGIAGGVTF
ncbi:MAG TPA: tetratricopeptide repeat protein [Polyangia bacterium]